MTYFPILKSQKVFFLINICLKGLDKHFSGCVNWFLDVLWNIYLYKINCKLQCKEEDKNVFVLSKIASRNYFSAHHVWNGQYWNYLISNYFII